MQIPDPSLVVLVGPSGSGKTTFARARFGAYEVVSSDFCRALVANDENDQTATRAAFEVLHAIVSRRLERRLLTVVDATSVQPEARRPLLDLARRHHLPCVAIVLALPEGLLEARLAARADRAFGPDVVRQHAAWLRRSLPTMGREGFAAVHLLRGAGEVERATIERVPLPVDRRDHRGPFDLIGDVHGCGDELLELLVALGWEAAPAGNGVPARWRHPAGRTAVFLGDLVDRGPRIPDVLRLAMAMVEDGVALAVPGNHDAKLVKALRGRPVQVTHGLAESLAQLEGEDAAFRARVAAFLDGLPSHLLLDGGALVAAHAGMKASLQGRDDRRVRDFALFGDTTGELDEAGLPTRLDWALEYRGEPHVAYGHTPVAEPEWRNRTINVDTGCVFGGRLTALRWPERELVSVPARARYATPRRAFLPDDAAAPRAPEFTPP